MMENKITVIVDGNVTFDAASHDFAYSRNAKVCIRIARDIDGTPHIARKIIQAAVDNLCRRRSAYPCRAPYHGTVSLSFADIRTIFLHCGYSWLTAINGCEV
jgi:hypothetical protein